MTHAEMLQTMTTSIAEQLGEQVGLEQRVKVAFGVWFRALLMNAPAQAQPQAPGLGQGLPQQNGAAPSDADMRGVQAGQAVAEGVPAAAAGLPS